MPKKIKRQPPTHVVIVHWVSDTLTILAQAPVPHADSIERRVLFVDHQSSLVPSARGHRDRQEHRQEERAARHYPGVAKLVMTAADRQEEEELGLYQRLQREAAQEEEKENPEREKQQERMRAYIRSRRRVIPGGGYVTSEEIQEEQERYLADLQALGNLMINGARGPNGGYRLAYLRSKYPTEYAHLRDIEISSK